MFVRIVLVMLSVAALTRAAAVPGNGNTVEPVCERYRFQSMCTREYSPVCGSDGVTYANECNFCLSARDPIYIIKKGMC